MLEMYFERYVELSKEDEKSVFHFFRDLFVE